MSYLIAIDHGNYAIKTPNFSFTSGLITLASKNTIYDTDIVEFGNQIWALSNERIHYMRDKTKDERFFILTLFAIAKELRHLGVDSPLEAIDLAVGLPPEHYATLKNKFKEYFQRGKVNFVYNNRPMTIIIQQVFVYPQAYAAIAPRAESLVDCPRVFIVDIGGYTTDVLLIRNGAPDLQFCRSLEDGVITMYNPIIGNVNAKHNMLIDDEHINSILQGKNTLLPDEVVRSVIESVKLHGNDIINRLRELRVDLRSNPAIFMGGGSLLFKPYLENSDLITRAEYEPNPKANALGYYIFGSRQVKKATGTAPANAVNQNGGAGGENI